MGSRSVNTNWLVRIVWRYHGSLTTKASQNVISVGFLKKKYTPPHAPNSHEQTNVQFVPSPDISMNSHFLYSGQVSVVNSYITLTGADREKFPQSRFPPRSATVRWSVVHLQWISLIITRCDLESKLRIKIFNIQTHWHSHWRIQGDARDSHPHFRSNFFRFHPVFSKIFAKY